MTTEELNLLIKEIILPQEKPKSTGNSHKLKQWENRRNWRLCTIGKSCKMAYVKICPLAKIKTPHFRRFKSPLCGDCICNLSSPWGMFMDCVSYDCDRMQYKKFSYNCTGFRRYLNRLIRRRTNNIEKYDIGNYSFYKKIFEYKWACV